MFWTALGTIAACVGAGVTWRQYRLQIRSDRDGAVMSSLRDVSGSSVVPPTGQLPAMLRGRDGVLEEMLRLLRRPSGQFVVLTGMGGVGKSTVAAVVAERAQQMRIRFRRPHVWWVSAADPTSLIGGMVTVAQRLGAPTSDIEAVDAGIPEAPDRLWSLLRGSRRRWILVMDNADDPNVLARPAERGADDDPFPFVTSTRSVGAGTGWLRHSQRGLVIVTSRNASRDTWGRHARIRSVSHLDEVDAAQVLLDHAPNAGDDTDARQLARRLGGLPLALRVAGSYLESDVALRRSFRDYEAALDEPDGSVRLLTIANHPDTDPREVVTRTWEMSLDALGQRGVPEARAMMRLLSCYAPATPIPLDLLQPERLASLFAAANVEAAESAHADAERSLERSLRHLRELGLVEVPFSISDEPALVIHPVVADTNRAHLLTGTDRVVADLVWRTSVALIATRLHGLSYDQPADWPKYRDLDPHLHALFETVAARIDRECLVSLVHATAVAARAHGRSGTVSLGERLARATFDAWELLGADDPSTLLMRHLFAWQRAIQGYPAEAEATYRDIIDRRRRVLGADHPDSLHSRHELAWVTAVQGRWAEAEVAYRKIIEARRRVLGDDHPDTLFSRHELAWAIANQGRGDEAETALHEVLDARQRVLGEDHPTTLASRHELAWATAIQGRWAEAEVAYRKVIEACRRVLGDDHPDTLTARHELAWTMAMQDRHKVAMAEYQAVLHTRESVLGMNHANTVATRESIQRLRHGKTTPATHLA